MLITTEIKGGTVRIKEQAFLDQNQITYTDDELHDFIERVGILEDSGFLEREAMANALKLVFNVGFDDE